MSRLYAALVVALGLCAGCDEPSDQGTTTDTAAAADTADTADTADMGDMGDMGDDTSAPEGAGWGPTLVGTTQVIPADNLPGGVSVMPSSNNLDVILHEERLFIAWRTAPDHFASSKTLMHVMSSDDDGTTWRFELTLSRNTDLREPRFVSVGGTLRLFFAVLGDSPVDFSPEGTMVTTWAGPGDWSEPTWALETGFIPWRIRTLDGLAWLIGYSGGENVYDEGGSIAIHWLTSSDGVDWAPAVPDQPVVLTGGGSEADFAFAPDGAVVAVVRNEAGDSDGFGSKVCRAEADALGSWTCRGDPRKYDSPLVFTHAGDIWLAARRNVTETGWYDLGLDIDEADKYLEYQLAYWQEPKRCALWRVDPDELEVTHVLDLPSGGDTCFPAILQHSTHSFTLFDYSSPIDAAETADLAWLEGQLGETRIYRHELTFAPAPQ